MRTVPRLLGLAVLLAGSGLRVAEAALERLRKDVKDLGP